MTEIAKDNPIVNGAEELGIELRRQFKRYLDKTPSAKYWLVQNNNLFYSTPIALQLIIRTLPQALAADCKGLVEDFSIMSISIEDLPRHTWQELLWEDIKKFFRRY